jgi:hypothetical protein
MKHILAILALGGMLASPASAQIDQSPGNWGNYGTIPNGSAYFKYPATPPEPVAPALKLTLLPPVKYDHEYRGGQIIVTRWHDYAMVRTMCRDNPTAIACSYRVIDKATGEDVSCLIALGPAAWNDERTLRHEIGHCNGWSDQHEGAR